MNHHEHLESGFLCRHLLCGKPSWPEGREPTWAELPALTMTIEVFESFLDATVTCTVCQVRAPFTVDASDEPAVWQSMLAPRVH